MNTIDQKHNYKERVVESFSESPEFYHKNASIQKKVAEGLAASIRPWKEIIPPGPILEVGCGTGFLSEQIAKEFSDREFVVTDASSQMVQFARNRLSELEKCSFEQFNIDEIKKSEPKYALIVSNFAAQWFEDPALGLEKLTNMLKPGGLLLTAFPGNQCFMEWYECCLELGIPYTANPLPDVEEIVVKLSLGNVQIDYYENDLFQDFSSSMEFFKHLKEIGAGTNMSGKSLSLKQLKLLTNFWDQKTNNQVKAKWHIVYLAAKKDMI